MLLMQMKRTITLTKPMDFSGSGLAAYKQTWDWYQSIRSWPCCLKGVMFSL